jgi:hypothetical protein
MKKIFHVAAFCAAIIMNLSAAEQKSENRVLEMRIYHTAPGKMGDLHTRFRDHTLKLFKKHGIKSVGYWTPVDAPDSKLLFLLEYPSKEAREASWKAFMADPDWQAAHKASEANGKLVEKVDQVFLEPLDYSKRDSLTGGEHVFELRTYTAYPGRLDALNARFRDHTVKLFSKHGMKHIGYWVPMAEQPGAGKTLIYLLAHDSRDAAKESFSNFGKDPDWTTARKASEEKAGGSLTDRGGVKSEFYKPTDYSPLK